MSIADELERHPDRPLTEWLADAFAAVDSTRRKFCADASSEGGDPPCWQCLPESYRTDECSAGCGTRAILAELAALRRQLGEARRVIEPFAEATDRMLLDGENAEIVGEDDFPFLQVGHFRLARAFLASTDAGGER